MNLSMGGQNIESVIQAVSQYFGINLLVRMYVIRLSKMIRRTE